MTPPPEDAAERFPGYQGNRKKALSRTLAIT